LGPLILPGEGDGDFMRALSVWSFIQDDPPAALLTDFDNDGTLDFAHASSFFNHSAPERRSFHPNR
jgi:hypothetical protein